jgi:sucrose phosphorylase
LSEWADSLSLPSQETTFFNFLASHDGIGLNPARGLLPDADIEGILQRVQRAGGLVSYKNNPDGSQSAYELNANYLDALSEPHRPGGLALGEARFAVAQAIQYALQGVPGVYVHSLAGSRGWPEGARQSGHNRTINRQKFTAPALFAELRNPGSARNRLYRVARRLLQARAASPAFDPYGSQQVIHSHPGALVLRREASGRVALCCHNLRAEQVTLRLPAQPGAWRSLLDEHHPTQAIMNELTLGPYQVVWLEKER